MSPAFSKRDESGLTSLEVDPGPLFKPDKNDGLGKRKIADLKMIDPLALCLDSSQMEAIYKSLAMAVSVIQVRGTCISWFIWNLFCRVLLVQGKPTLELS